MKAFLLTNMSITGFCILSNAYLLIKQRRQRDFYILLTLSFLFVTNLCKPLSLVTHSAPGARDIRIQAKRGTALWLEALSLLWDTFLLLLHCPTFYTLSVVSEHAWPLKQADSQSPRGGWGRGHHSHTQLQAWENLSFVHCSHHLSPSWKRCDSSQYIWRKHSEPLAPVSLVRDTLR